MKQSNSTAKKKVKGFNVFKLLPLIIALVVSVWVWHKIQQVTWWTLPAETPAVSGSGILDHTGHVLWAKDLNDKKLEWVTILTQKDKILKLSIDLPGNPTRQDFDTAWGQVIGRFVYGNGARSQYCLVRDLLKLKDPDEPAIEVAAITGKHKRIWLIEDHVPRQRGF